MSNSAGLSLLDLSVTARTRVRLVAGLHPDTIRNLVDILTDPLSAIPILSQTRSCFGRGSAVAGLVVHHGSNHDQGRGVEEHGG